MRPPCFVMDASVGAKLFILESDSEQASALIQIAASLPMSRIIVPDLFFIECANIAWKQIRRRILTTEIVLPGLMKLYVLPLINVPSRELYKTAFELAAEHNISAYDGCYVALAQRENAPLITADEKLIAAMKGKTVAVQHFRTAIEAW